MRKKLTVIRKTFNWGLTGVFLILTSFMVLVIYLVTGGLPAKGGKILKGPYGAECANTMSAFFFLLGIIFLVLAFVKRIRRKNRAREIKRWR